MTNLILIALYIEATYLIVLLTLKVTSLHLKCFGDNNFDGLAQVVWRLKVLRFAQSLRLEYGVLETCNRMMLAGQTNMSVVCRARVSSQT